MAECQIPWIGIEIWFQRQKSNQISNKSQLDHAQHAFKHVKGAKAEPALQLRQPEGLAG